MKKYKLGIEADFNFDLIGLVCHQNDYRLCWAINDALDLKLQKADQPFLVSGKQGSVVSEHSLYTWDNELEDTQYFLIQNKDKTNFLIPEKAQIDFFLVVKEAGLIDLKAVLSKLKLIDSILMAIIFNPEEIKSANRLILDY